jgi:hypothetical protein
MARAASLAGAPALVTVLALGAPLALGACKKQAPESAPDIAASSVARTTEGEPKAVPVEHIDLLGRIDACDIEHRGILLDLGTEAAGARRRFTIDGPPEGNVVDREGASFERVQKRELAFDVWLDQPIVRPSLSLRVHGGAARLVHLQIDDTRLGALRLRNAETRILSTAPASAALGRGRHRVFLRFTGAQRGNKAVLADLDWRPEAHAAPTREDVIANVALDRVPKQSLVLRAPSTVRCWLRPGSDARLKLALGLWGSGSGVAEVGIVRDGEKPVTLATRKVTGGDRATWSAVSLDLAEYAGSLIGLELSARETTRGGRIAFGDPRILPREETTHATPRADVVVVVVLASADRRRVPPWGPTGALRTLGELTRTAVAFGAHRAPTTVPAGVMGTLLTGLPPRAHGVEDTSAKLAPELHTLAEIVKEASGRTAMFTGAPTTFAPFGFDQGWDVYETLSPVKDLSASEAIHRAARFIDHEVDEDRASPTFVVVHARGGHPPWDVSREEAQQLKPAEYAGAIDPRRGGIILGALRAHRRGGKRLLDDDWVRVHALSDFSLMRQDAALGQLIQVLKRKGVWDRTLLAVTSDVAPGDPPDFPYDPMGSLTEDRLLLPLLVKFPEPRGPAREVTRSSSVEDLSFTILTALGLKPASAIRGVDLYASAIGREALVMRAEVATLPGRYSTRLGQRLLRGQIGDVPSLCAFDVDPACAANVFDQELIAARALWHATFVAEGSARRLTPAETSRRPVVLDPDTSAALVVWGDQE